MTEEEAYKKGFVDGAEWRDEYRYAPMRNEDKANRRWEEMEKERAEGEWEGYGSAGNWSHEHMHHDGIDGSRHEHKHDHGPAGDHHPQREHEEEATVWSTSGEEAVRVGLDGDHLTPEQPGPEECPNCEGRGWNEITYSTHDPRCDGSCEFCPVPVLAQEQCSLCSGTGKVEQPGPEECPELDWTIYDFDQMTDAHRITLTRRFINAELVPRVRELMKWEKAQWMADTGSGAAMKQLQQRVEELEKELEEEAEWRTAHQLEHAEEGSGRRKMKDQIKELEKSSAHHDELADDYGRHWGKYHDSTPSIVSRLEDLETGKMTGRLNDAIDRALEAKLDGHHVIARIWTRINELEVAGARADDEE